MNLETNFQMLENVTKYADYEFNFFKFVLEIFTVYEKERDHVAVELSIEKRPRPKGSLSCNYKLISYVQLTSV